MGHSAGGGKRDRNVARFLLAKNEVSYGLNVCDQYVLVGVLLALVPSSSVKVEAYFVNYMVALRYPLFPRLQAFRFVKNPAVLISDGAPNFHQAYLKEYRTLTRETKHIRHIHLEGDHSNNKIERLNGEIRDREKVMRGVKKMDSIALKGYQMYHNYFREHQGLVGKTPAEVAGIKIESDNKWMTVIQNAAKAT